MDIFQSVRQNLHVMSNRAEFLEGRIQSIKVEIAALGDLRPGAMSLQYNICGNPSCRCKADPPVKHGPYPQVSFTWHGKSSSQFVRQEDVEEVRQQLENYHRLRDLVDEWIGLALELSRLRLRERREAAVPKKKPKNHKIPTKIQAAPSEIELDDGGNFCRCNYFRVSGQKLASGGVKLAGWQRGFASHSGSAKA